jgi:hypothetical protein
LAFNYFPQDYKFEFKKMDESAILRFIDDADEEVAKGCDGTSNEKLAMAPTADSGLGSLASEGLFFEVLIMFFEY